MKLSLSAAVRRVCLSLMWRRRMFVQRSTWTSSLKSPPMRTMPLFRNVCELLGFREDTSKGAPLCRWLIDGMKLDVMPIEEKIFGFSNRWYRAAMYAAQEIELEPGLRIRALTPPYFVATKLEAFRGRGRGDFTSSHDLEDLLAVVDGRVEIVSEIASTGDLRPYIAEQFRTLLGTPAFIDALPGHLLPDAGSQARLPILLNRLKEVST